MNGDLIQTLIQSSPATGIMLMVLYYLSKKDKEGMAMVNKFTSTINGYLKEANKTQANLAVKINEFNETNKELKDALQKIYIHNKTVVDENKRLKAQSVGQS